MQALGFLGKGEPPIKLCQGKGCVTQDCSNEKGNWAHFFLYLWGSSSLSEELDCVMETRTKPCWIRMTCLVQHAVLLTFTEALLILPQKGLFFFA